MPKLMPRRQAGHRHLQTAPKQFAVIDNMLSEMPGDIDDFGQLVEQQRPLLHRVALRLSGDPETAKDLVQETLLRALRRFDRFQPGTHAGTWLITILTHVFYDQLRHRKVMTKAEPDLVVTEAVESDPTLSVIPDADLYAAIQALEPELREVVELCYLKQMRYREVAAVLNVPMGTIGTRLMRARTRLRTLLTAGREES
jgi:RNA polymerase sigma-70 factor (ECF subfamily)